VRIPMAYYEHLDLGMNTTTKLPDLLMIGAAKAGTTARFRVLSRRPQIYCSPIKEPQFFA